MLALLGGRFAEAERLIEQSAALGEECGEPGARDVRHDQDWDLRAGQGRLGELAGALPEMFPDPDSLQARGLRALALLAAGERAQAAQVVGTAFQGRRDPLPRMPRMWSPGSAPGRPPGSCTKRCCPTPARRWCPVP